MAYHRALQLIQKELRTIQNKLAMSMFSSAPEGSAVWRLAPPLIPTWPSVLGLRARFVLCARLSGPVQLLQGFFLRLADSSPRSRCAVAKSRFGLRHCSPPSLGLRRCYSSSPGCDDVPLQHFHIKGSQVLCSSACAQQSMKRPQNVESRGLEYLGSTLGQAEADPCKRSFFCQ